MKLIEIRGRRIMPPTKWTRDVQPLAREGKSCGSRKNCIARSGSQIYWFEVGKANPPPPKKFFNVEFGNLGAMFGFHRIDLQKI